MHKKLIAAGVVAAFLVALGTAVIPELMRARSAPAVNACVNNLRQLDGAKQQWELKTHRTTNDPAPAITELSNYLRQTLICPQGGTYTVDRVGQSPKCSIGARIHYHNEATWPFAQGSAPDRQKNTQE